MKNDKATKTNPLSEDDIISVCQRNGLTITDKFLFVFLISHRRTTLLMHPEYISEALGISLVLVTRGLDRLSDQGLVEIDGTTIEVKHHRIVSAKPGPQNTLFDIKIKKPADDDLNKYRLARDVDDLYFLYLYDMKECWGKEVVRDIPSSLRGKVRGQWSQMLRESDAWVATHTMRLIVWDWEKVKCMWRSWELHPCPTPSAIFLFAEKVRPFLRTGITSKKSQGRDRGWVSPYRRRFLDKDESGDNLDWVEV